SLWADHTGANVHHNVFVGGVNDVGGILVLYDSRVQIHNNTFDALNSGSLGSAVMIYNGDVQLSSNLMVNVPKTAVVNGGTLAADYNLFWRSAAPAYNDNRS